MGKHKHCKHYIQEHKENIRLKRIIKEKDEEQEEKERRIAYLEKKLLYYENPNSPPSANSLLWKKQKKERRERIRDGNGDAKPKKLGREKGHKGVSHSFKPTETIEHTLDMCNKCGSSRISFTHKEYSVIVDVPEPQPYTVKEHIINVYHCNRCDSEVRPEADIPEHGMLGKNLLAMITSLWSEARLPMGKIDSINAQSSLWIEDICRNDKQCIVQCIKITTEIR